jgi:hypothetical protein
MCLLAYILPYKGEKDKPIYSAFRHIIKAFGQPWRESPQPVTVRRSDLPGAAAAGADPQRLGLVASLPRVLGRIQRGEGRGKGCRCASPWVNVARLVRIPQPGTVRRCSPTSCASSVVLLLHVSNSDTKEEGAAAAGADPQRVGLVASLLRVLVRIQRGEGRGKGCRFASPWANVARLVRIPQPGTVRRPDLPGAAAWKISAARIRSAWARWPRCCASW